MRRADSRVRAAEASDLRACLRTWQEIADVLGYASRGAAKLAVERYRARNRPESAAEARRTSVDRTEIVMRALIERFAAAKYRGDDQALVLLAREIRGADVELAKLQGLNAPARSEVSVRPDRAFLEAWWSRLKSMPPGAVQRQLPVVDAEVVVEGGAGV